MAVTLEADDACFAAFYAAFLADSSAAINALNDATMSAGAYNSNAFLLGGFERRGDPILSGHPTCPRIEWESVGLAEAPTQEHARVEGVVRLHHLTDRNPPDGYGSQQNVALRSRRVFHKGALGTQGGWSFSTLSRGRGFQAMGTATEQHYIVEYKIIMSAGVGGGF